jgi:hypothetical protein
VSAAEAYAIERAERARLARERAWTLAEVVEGLARRSHATLGAGEVYPLVLGVLAASDVPVDVPDPDGGKGGAP